MSFRGSAKKPEEYSTNPNTMRARARKAKLDPYTREVEAAKSSDAKAISRAWNLAIKEKTYKNATPNQRKTMLEQIEKDVNKRRFRKGLDATSKLERFLKQNPSAMPNISPEPSSTSDAIQEHKDNLARIPHLQPLGGLNHTSDSAPPASRQTPLPDPNRHPMPNGVPQAVFPYQRVPQQHEHRLQIETPVQESNAYAPQMLQQYSIYGQQDGADRLFDPAVIANLQATVQRQEYQIQNLSRAVQHLSVDLVLCKNAANAQNALLANVQSQLKVFYERSAQVHGVDSDFVHQASHLRQLLDEVQRIAGTASNFCTSMVTGGPDQVAGHQVNDAMSEYSQSETDSHSHVEHGATYSTEGSPDDADQSNHSRMEMDQVNETATGNDQPVDLH